MQTAIKQQYTSSFESVRVFVEDESRFGLMPVTRRRITAKGVKPIQKCKMSFQNYYLYGSIEPITGENFFFEFPKLNSDCFQIFLNEFSKKYSNSLNIMLLDNGAFHKAKKLIIPNNTVLLFFPPFSPELNPIERFWLDVKDQIASMIFHKLQDLADYVTSIIKKYSLDAIASLTGYQYFVNAVYSLSF